MILNSQLNMREWLSGRASPCQGERREFESRLPLQKSTNESWCFFSEKRDENEQSSSQQPESRDRLLGLWSREHEVFAGYGTQPSEKTRAHRTSSSAPKKTPTKVGVFLAKREMRTRIFDQINMIFWDYLFFLKDSQLKR